MILISRKSKQNRLKHLIKRFILIMNKIGEKLSKFFHWVSPTRKYVYYFNEGSSEDKELLGQKGSNLCEMFRLGLPVPHGFIISSEASSDFFKGGGSELSKELTDEIAHAVKEIELETGKYFGLQPLGSFPKKTDRPVPLLLSVRSDAAIYMPGMMPSILNLGLNDTIVDSMIHSSSNVRWVYDTYRRFLQMFGSTVYDVPISRYNDALDALLARKGVKDENHLGVSDLIELVNTFKNIHEVPEDPWMQLGMAVAKVMRSWWSEKAVKYRDLHNVPEDLSAGIVIQSMVYGNRNAFSGSGLAYSRNPVTGERGLSGEYLPNSEGDDVVQGLRTPMSLMDLFREQPGIFEKLTDICGTLEKHFQDVQAVEFTVDSGYLYILETREAFRTSEAAANFAISLVNEGVISERSAIMRVDADFLKHYLHTQVDRRAVLKGDKTIKSKLLGSGLPASFGAVTGYFVFDMTAVNRFSQEGKTCVLYKQYAAIDDSVDYTAIGGMLTSKGGTTSDLSALLRGYGKELVVSATDIVFDETKRVLHQLEGDVTVQEGELLTIDGSTGLVYAGEIPLKVAEMTNDLQILMGWANRYKSIAVMAEANTLEDAKRATDSNADGIGLCRMDSLLKDKSCIELMRQFLLCEREPRQLLLQSLAPILQSMIFDMFKVVGDGSFMFQLLDCNLSSFFPDMYADDYEQRIQQLASQCGIGVSKCRNQIRDYREINPMLGFRGARVAIVEDLLLQLQVSAITAAVIRARTNEMNVDSTVMIPTVFSDLEVSQLVDTILKHKESVCQEYDQDSKLVPVDIGVMLSTPRACLRANKIASVDQVSSVCFDTDRLTQLMLGVSWDDSHMFLDEYMRHHILGRNPFTSLDTKSVGAMLSLSMNRFRESNRVPNRPVRIGVTGKHCAEQHSINFIHREHVDFVVCPATFVPTVKIAAAQAKIREYYDNRAHRFRPDISPMWPMYSIYPGLV